MKTILRDKEAEVRSDVYRLLDALLGQGKRLPFMVDLQIKTDIGDPNHPHPFNIFITNKITKATKSYTQDADWSANNWTFEFTKDLEAGVFDSYPKSPTPQKL